MSNVLIIKHGSLGDLIQANGAIKDIKEFYQNRKVFLLTSAPYSIFMSECPYIDGVIIDKRLPRWNLFFLYNYQIDYLFYQVQVMNFDLKCFLYVFGMFSLLAIGKGRAWAAWPWPGWHHSWSPAVSSGRRRETTYLAMSNL